MKHYIYKTTNTITGKYYIGMHSAKRDNDGYMGSGKILSLSIKKYGREAHLFEILEFFPDRRSLALRERELVNESTITDPLCMNLKIGGEGGGCKGSGCGLKKGFKHSAETKRKISANHSRHSLGKPMPPSLREKLDRTGKRHSESTKAQISVRVSEVKSKTWIVENPFGEITEVTNLKKFCKEISLNYTTLILSRDRGEKIVRGRSKGWRLVGEKQ